ncbi:hypothetical protein C463_03342 [Halorubrum californiense DSM 19288]|uniref:Pyridoxamine 5'-phosphate oxidase family protein n=1 Tax=Halorubrum californiense DSM 19288 TaxID=1227465 RepID=M0EIK4_9EURY|nr:MULTISPECIES: pyridoxamine 5'-phosphate oxidase family protein [Halorubrum]ELZ46903.1 hypothetical protein C463_03342 [Halorubrum californiense DSM 19288]TKX67585.1 pyridoxamine 5'-phosphate oxidase family protein [Halorubrum sp. GN11GM_10-3_MGM]
MEHVEYVYTSGMTGSDIDARLRAGEHGVLGLADGDDAYAVPLSYHYDGDRPRFRASAHDGDDEKGRSLETTDTATFVCYASSTDASWSVHARGPLRRSERAVDEATLNEWFQPFRLFAEAVEAVEFTLYELRPETLIGRATPPS